MKPLKILWPFSLLYQAITGLRNQAFNKGILKSRTFKTSIIAVGNLSTGGTGKTPFVEFLLNHLPYKKIGLVSRGYGRKTKGLLVAKPSHQSKDIGDEPLQVFKKFPEIHLAVSEKRAVGINALEQKFAPELILLDDAFQHRSVQPKVNILLSSYDKPFYRDLVLPAGHLRESRSGKKRAQLIIITKCPPDLSSEKAAEIKVRIKPQKDQSIFFTSIGYSSCINHLNQTINAEHKEILALCGIAKPHFFLNEIENYFTIKKQWIFKDHHAFSAEEIKALQHEMETTGLPLVCTEKDWVRLLSLLDEKHLERCYYLPIQTQFLFKQEANFLNTLHKML